MPSKEKPISMLPLKFKEAVADLLKVKPPEKVAKEQSVKPTARNKRKRKKRKKNTVKLESADIPAHGSHEPSQHLGGTRIARKLTYPGRH
jgi:hypothetical protein